MDYEMEEKTGFDGKKVKVIGKTYEAGTPEGEGPGKWRQKISTREEMLKYLEYGERYWFSDEWYGSEKRKNPA